MTKSKTKKAVSIDKYIVACMLLFMISFIGGCAGAGAKQAEANVFERLKVIGSRQADEDLYARPKIIIDTTTGVNYLSTNDGGVCVMVDAEGKPLVTDYE